MSGTLLQRAIREAKKASVSGGWLRVKPERWGKGSVPFVFFVTTFLSFVVGQKTQTDYHAAGLQIFTLPHATSLAALGFS
jgi:hypothetical protein